MMKKLTSLVLVAVLALSLTACGKTSVELDKEEIILTSAGETAVLTAESKKELTWSSSDESVATVDQNGTVTAVAPGTATITVSAGEDVTASCAVTCDWQAVVDLTAFYTALCEQYGENFPANADIVEFGMLGDMFPGLGDIPAKQLLAYQPMMGAVVCEIVLVEVENAADVETVKTILQARIDAQINGGAWYPESIEGWQNNSRIVSSGNYVMMIAYQECDAIVEAFNGLF